MNNTQETQQDKSANLDLAFPFLAALCGVWSGVAQVDGAVLQHISTGGAMPFGAGVALVFGLYLTSQRRSGASAAALIVSMPVAWMCAVAPHLLSTFTP